MGGQLCFLLQVNTTGRAASFGTVSLPHASSDRETNRELELVGRRDSYGESPVTSTRIAIYPIFEGAEIAAAKLWRIALPVRVLVFLLTPMGAECRE